MKFRGPRRSHHALTNCALIRAHWQDCAASTENVSLFNYTVFSCSPESTQVHQNLTIRHIVMAIAQIHNCERDAGFRFRSLNFAFKQCDLNDIGVLSPVKVWIPWAVFLLPLSLSQ